MHIDSEMFESNGQWLLKHLPYLNQFITKKWSKIYKGRANKNTMAFL